MNWFHLLLFIALAVGSFAIHAQSAYLLKESEPRVGSRIRMEILRSPIPFDKRYEELTVEQMAVLRSKYNQLGENDEPPFPEGGMWWIGKEISKLPRNPLAHGPLVITVRVDDKGAPQSTAIYKTPDASFARSIATIVMNAKYKPAKCDGKACAMDFPFIFDVGVGN
jgi:hypothetical protein